MGGTQRMAERAGPARAREFVMTGDLYDAATLERWNVVNRVVPDDELEDATMKFAKHLAVGPTKAHAATKRDGARVPRRRRAGGGRARSSTSPRRCSPPRTCRTRVDTFLAEGPGKATFKGR